MRPRGLRDLAWLALRLDAAWSVTAAARVHASVPAASLSKWRARVSQMSELRDHLDRYREHYKDIPPEQIDTMVP